MLILFLTVLTGAALFAQDNITTQIKQAVDNLATRLNRPLEITISPVTIEGSDTPTALSRFLAGKINLFASTHAMFKVFAPSRSRGVGSKQQSDSQTGKITGNRVLFLWMARRELIVSAEMILFFPSAGSGTA
jgi:hypothetical protein